MKNVTLCLALVFMSLSTVAAEEVERLLGVTTKENGIEFQVASGGCTTADDFDFQVKEILEAVAPMLPAYEYHYYITVRRLKPDRCEHFLPYGTTVFKSYEELGILSGQFHIENPVGGQRFIELP